MTVGELGSKHLGDHVQVSMGDDVFEGALSYVGHRVNILGASVTSVRVSLDRVEWDLGEMAPDTPCLPVDNGLTASKLSV